VPFRSPDTGVVVSPDKQPLLLAPAVTGYFMARNAHGWQRLVIVEPLKGNRLAKEP
jgi:hypothetical protein